MVPGPGLILGPLGGVAAVIGVIVLMRRSTRLRAAAAAPVNAAAPAAPGNVGAAPPLPAAWNVGGETPQP